MTKKQSQFTIVQKDIKTLRINPKNPRVIKDINFKKLMRSIEEFPEMLQIRPIVHDKSGMILGGTQRFEACKQLKWKTVPAIDATTLTAEQKKKFIALDNVSFGDWDMDKLKEQWKVDDLESWGLLPAQKIVAFDVKLPEQKWFLNIEFSSEAEIQEYYDRFKKEGLNVKIVQ